MIKRFCVSLLGLALLISGCGGRPASVPSTGSDQPPPKTESVTVAWTKTLSFSPFFIAMEKGYFKDEGIELNLKEFAGGADATAAIASGQVDALLGGWASGFFNAIEQKLDFRVVASLAVQPEKNGTFPLVARKDLWENGTIKSGKDLKGKKVAINSTGAIVEYKLALILEKHGLSLKDVQVVTIGFPDMIGAFRSKAIDAAVISEPFATKSQTDGLAVAVPGDSDLAAGDLTTSAFFGGKFMQGRPDVAVRFLKAVVRGSRDIQDGKHKNPENVAILSKITGLGPDDITAAAFPLFDPDLNILRYVESLDRQQQVYLKTGRLKYSEPFDPKNLIDASFLEKAVTALKR